MNPSENDLSPLGDGDWQEHLATNPETRRVVRQLAGGQPDLSDPAENALLEDLDGALEPELPAVDPGDMSKPQNNELLVDAPQEADPLCAALADPFVGTVARAILRHSRPELVEEAEKITTAPADAGDEL